MSEKLFTTPEIGKTCPALMDENYGYHLSGDAYSKYNKCMLNGRTCMGIVVTDPDDQSTRFFRRGKPSIDLDEIKKCPVYGSSKETIKAILQDKNRQEMDKKLEQLK